MTGSQPNTLDNRHIFEKSRKTARGLGIRPPAPGVGESGGLPLDASLQREQPADLPELSEPEVVRHYLNGSVLNHHVDRGFYPLGSCTMKYNPKINDWAAGLEGFARLHPETDDREAQGALAVIHALSQALAEITGMDEITLTPSAGAQGETVGLLIARAHFAANGESERRRRVIIPDSSHGTNPASVAIAGFEPVPVRSNAGGLVDLDAITAEIDDRLAVVMLTNPNTLGLFERDIVRIADAVHAAGGIMYNDGANTNALMGITRAGDMGFDVLHLNLHKTFSTPHGGGGPGAAAVGVRSHLARYLPGERIEKTRDAGTARYARRPADPASIGPVQPYAGNFAVLVRAWAYIMANGPEGLRRVSEDAIINANYLRTLIARDYDIPHAGPCQHEFVASATRQKKQGVRAGTIAKRLLDFGVHAPTTYFPLIVPEALMIEPTETESREDLDRFAAIMKTIAEEVATDPDMVNNAPHTTPVTRVDEARAARELNVKA